MTVRTIFFSVGEPSGDLHGANLIRELRRRDPDVRCVGLGGPRMAAAGCQLHWDLTQLAVMWFWRVLLNLGTFWRLLRQANQYFRDHRPTAVVLIDYPGFNWWVARAARKHGVPVFYYGPPQMWAWAGWRVRKMRQLVDHVLCKLPFEVEWYRRRNCNATYVGHPYFDQTQNQQLDETFLDEQRRRPGALVAILPGSRSQEVANHLPWFLKAARLIRAQVPQVRFALASYNEKQAEFARTAIAHEELPIDVFVGRTAELIRLSECCLACSGSVSLELLYHAKPTVILYRLNRGLYYLARFVLLRVKYITLVNLLAVDDPFFYDSQPYDPDAPNADAIPFPEYPTYGDESARLAKHITEWLVDPERREAKVAQLTELKNRFASPGASQKAAEYILHAIAQRPAVRRPHFLERQRRSVVPANLAPREEP